MNMKEFYKKYKKFFIPLGTAVVVSIFSYASIAFATLTFSTNSITGDTNVEIDTPGALLLGTASATAVTVGRIGAQTTFPGSINVVGNTTTTQSFTVIASGTVNYDIHYRLE